MGGQSIRMAEEKLNKINQENLMPLYDTVKTDAERKVTRRRH
jgi:hypothetical protein